MYYGSFCKLYIYNVLVCRIIFSHFFFHFFIFYWQNWLFDTKFCINAGKDCWNIMRNPRWLTLEPRCRIRLQLSVYFSKNEELQNWSKCLRVVCWCIFFISSYFVWKWKNGMPVWNVCMEIHKLNAHMKTVFIKYSKPNENKTSEQDTVWFLCVQF